jgi:glyoxylase-like metal-dependent hydrolase (beta-lactamase superfamily II)
MTKTTAAFLLLASFTLTANAQILVGREARPPDLAGEWQLQNDEDPGQPPLGDYLGIPFNDAGRQRADTAAESIWGTSVYRCRPHSAPHQWRGLGGARIMKELDPLTRDVSAYHVQFWRSLDRPIYLDGRAHPPAWAPHTWSGFSTGEWEGNTLVVTTTHLKDGFLKRGGPQTSDMYTMTEYLTRNDDYLTVTQIVDDPIYMDEPYVQSTTFWLDANTAVMMESCVTSALGEGGGTDPHFVPHYLPGQNPYLSEWLEEEDWIPEPATRGGAETAYPEYAAANGRRARPPLSTPAFDVGDRIRAQSPSDGQIHVLPVQGNIYMLVADGVNLTVSVGPDGVMLVNTGTAETAERVLDVINELSRNVAARARPNDCIGVNCPGFAYGWTSPSINAVISSPAPARPIRYVVNTSADRAHTGGNTLFAEVGFFARRGGTNVLGETASSSVIAHENVLNALSAPTGQDPVLPPEAWPTDTYFHDFQKLSEYFNGEPVIIYHEPAANTDGDSIVFFRGSEVISAGEMFSTVSYPMIDVERGGTIQGVIDGLNHLLDLAVAEYRSQAGTWIIPSRGRLADTADVAAYRNMVTIVRDRVQSLVSQGMSVGQVIAARPTLDFDGRYNVADEDWTAEQFVAAVYATLPGR